MWPFKLIGLLVKYSVKLGLSLPHCQWIASFWSGFDLLTPCWVIYTPLTRAAASVDVPPFESLALAASLVFPNRERLNGIKAAFPSLVPFQSH